MLNYLINIFHRGIQFCQVYVLHIIYWLKLACIFQYSSMVLQNHTHHQGTCINSQVYFFPGHATISLGWAILVNITTVICLRRAFFTVSCHLFISILTCLLILPVAKQSYSQIGKYFTNFPKMENTMCCISVTEFQNSSSIAVCCAPPRL